MSFKLKISLTIFSIVLFIITTHILKKGKMPIKYSLLWYFSAVIILIVSLFPSILELFQKLFGFETLSNLVIGILISILLFLTMSVTVIIAGLNKRITLLIQEISTLKSELEGSDKRWNTF